MLAGTTNLADYLVEIGVDVRRAGQEISARCPVHVQRTGKEDNSPSWSMNSDTGLWVCYSCGAKGNLSQLIVQLTGKEDEEAMNLVMSLGVERLLAPEWERKVEADIHEYLRYEPVPKRMLRSRSITEEVAKAYGIRWNPDNNGWILPMVDVHGNLMGWQEKGRGFTYNHPTGVKKGNTLFGINLLSSKTALLVESPLDVARFSSSFDGIGCLASFGAVVSKTQINLLTDRVDKIIIALDNDDAGILSAEKIFKEMPLVRGGVLWLKYSHTKAKDIGEMTDDELEEAVKGASILPWWL